MFSTSGYCHFKCVVSIPKVPNVRSLHIFAVSPEKHGEWSWFFLRADKRKSFLRVDIITLGILSQACSKYPNNKFAISLQNLKKEVSGEVVFLHADKHESFLQIDTVIFDRDGQVLPNFPKWHVCNACNFSKKKLEIKLIFFACK